MFNKDILLVDLEMTGLDPHKHEIIQLAAVLIDKKTLKVKKEYSSFIKPKHWDRRDSEAMAINKIPKKILQEAPPLKAVMKEYKACFPGKVLFAYYGGPADFDFLRAAYESLGQRYPFPGLPYDYHLMNLWPIFYAYAALKKKLKNRRRFTGFSLDDLAKHFKIKPPGKRHDALTDCLVEAEVFRRIMLEFKK